MHQNQIEAIQAAARLLGNQAALARALGVTPVTVGQWLKPEQRTGRHVPPKQCVRIEQLTDGQVTRRALRPDDWQEIWPELSDYFAGREAAVAQSSPAQPEPVDDAWDGITERRKLNAPPDRRVSAESVARAEFLRSQSDAKLQGD